MNFPLRTIIVENEDDSIVRLRQIVDNFPNLITITSVAKSFDSALETIRARHEELDLAILDINLGDGKSGYSLFDELGYNFFKIVAFSTVETQIDMQISSKIGKFHYLLKPYSLDGVLAFLFSLLTDERIKNRIQSSSSLSELIKSKTDVLWNSQKREDRQRKFVCFKYDKLFLKLPNEDIWFIRRSVDYVEVFCRNEKGEEKRYLIRETLSKFHNRLDPNIFVRCHRNCIVNTDKIRGYSLDDTGGNLYFVTHAYKTGFKDKDHDIEIRFGQEFRAWLDKEASNIENFKSE